MPYVKVAHEVDPKQKLIEEIGDISSLKVLHHQVLVAVYQRPRTAMLGGKTFHLADTTVAEDRFQSKVGLIVAMGPTAFANTGEWKWDEEFNIHDWIVFPPSSGWNVTVNGVLCRMLPDTGVKMKSPDPDMIY